MCLIAAIRSCVDFRLKQETEQSPGESQQCHPTLLYRSHRPDIKCAECQSSSSSCLITPTRQSVPPCGSHLSRLIRSTSPSTETRHAFTASTAQSGCPTNTAADAHKSLERHRRGTAPLLATCTSQIIHARPARARAGGPCVRANIYNYGTKTAETASTRTGSQAHAATHILH